MIKAIFFDADGVTIHSRAVFFSQRFAVQQGISHEDILPFFKNDMHDALVGKVDIKEALQKYLPLWKWEGGVEDFLQHWFSEESPPNIEVLHYIQELRQRGIMCYLATGREQYWAQYLMNVVGFKDYFDGFMFSYQLGHEKDDPQFFIKALERLSLEPSEVLYFDDTEEDVLVARKAGIDAMLYTGFENLVTILQARKVLC